MSENGWTDDQIGLKRFKKSFIPQSKAHSNSTKPILLLYNGHRSHIGLDWIKHVQQNNIILFCLPPHTSHHLQPLDVSCFSPLQTAWFNCYNAILSNTGELMELQDIVKEYWAARAKAFQESMILQAWHKSGICPLNPGIFTDADFAPSIMSSTKVQLPKSFPRHIP
ncbi:hypothetical protein GYMLUDRAFT_182066 [Collybiopsis luxurians FD-317 M1]|uniref:DDE-1 domain-containing protein n=1 Tax=Collybiopsis luxurians FD-317 M1 TaxID=944289 RepID=A0A0D0AL45_9AGAR|nr:hypothetical protein GYMLUDRAFT_182066 [Collybiopsis luxurians FD-317 M1]